MFILLSSGKARRANRMAAKERPWLSLRRTTTSSKPWTTGSPQLLLAAHAAGDAGRVPVRLRHLQHRLGAELRPLQPARPGAGVPGLRGLARRGGGRDPGRPGLGPLRPQAAADPGRGHLRRRRAGRGDRAGLRAAAAGERTVHGGLSGHPRPGMSEAPEAVADAVSGARLIRAGGLLTWAGPR